jgi:hypothetical protein
MKVVISCRCQASWRGDGTTFVAFAMIVAGESDGATATTSAGVTAEAVLVMDRAHTTAPSADSVRVVRVRVCASFLSCAAPVRPLQVP